jgi:uncharacterized protein
MINQEQLKTILLDHQEQFIQAESIIPREIDLTPYINTRQIVVITGIRRCGKSTLLHLLREAMHLSVGDYSYINFDDERLPPDVKILEMIFNLHLELYGKEPILFWDEIQIIPGWEKFISRKYEAGTKIFVTGSNAQLLSSEISSSLTGRNKTVRLFPFSFREYLRFTGQTFDAERLSSSQIALLSRELHYYLEFGGFPLVLKEGDLELVHGYFQDILYRDIVARYRLSQVAEIRSIALWFASNIGKIFSYSALQDITGIKSLSSIKSYLTYYESAYLFLFLRKFDFSLKKQLLNPRKVYTIDPAFARRLGFQFSPNKGRLLENMALLELLRQEREVFYFLGKRECDFIVRKGLQTEMAIQIVWTLDRENLQREMEGLIEAMQFSQAPQGLILYFENATELPETPPNITFTPIWKWLLTGHNSPKTLTTDTAD